VIIRTSRPNVSFETFNHLGDPLGTLKDPRTTASGVQSGRFDRLRLGGTNHLFVREPANWHRDWDRHRDHFWRGHRCRFVNGTWTVFDEGFYPDDFYPDDYSYDNSDAASVYPSSSYDSRSSDLIVFEVQVALRSAGYDPGSTDGMFGPDTREAISRYQRDHGLDVTGSITDPVLQALGLVEVE
jgi:Putative peptidoglycan binding domain